LTAGLQLEEKALRDTVAATKFLDGVRVFVVVVGRTARILPSPALFASRRPCKSLGNDSAGGARCDDGVDWPISFEISFVRHGATLRVDLWSVSNRQKRSPSNAQLRARVRARIIA